MWPGLLHIWGWGDQSEGRGNGFTWWWPDDSKGQGTLAWEGDYERDYMVRYARRTQTKQNKICHSSLLLFEKTNISKGCQLQHH